MSYSEEIEKYRREAALISANLQMSLDLLMKCYTESGVVLICNDGRCIDMIMEEDTNGCKET